jgi:hypothetical protein
MTENRTGEVIEKQKEGSEEGAVTRSEEEE